MISDPQASAAQQTSEDRCVHLGLLFVLLAVLSRVIRYARTPLVAFGGTGGSAWDIEVSKILLLLPFGMAVIHLLLHPRERLIRIDEGLKILSLLLGFGVLSVLWALYPRAVTLWTLNTMLYFSVYFIIVLFTVRWHDLQPWGYMFLCMSFALAAMAGHEMLLFGQVKGFAGPGGGPYTGIYGRWTTMAFPFVVHYLLYGRNRLENIAGYAGVFSCLLTIGLSTRRAPLLALPIILVTYLVVLRRRRRQLLLVGGLMVAGMALVIITNATYRQRVSSMFTLAGTSLLQNEELSQRFINLLAGANATRDHLLLGVGAGSFKPWSEDVFGTYRPINPHNLTLYLTANLGVVGLGIFIAFVASVWRRMRRAVDICLQSNDLRTASFVASVFASFIGMLFYSQFQPFFHSTNLYIVAALGSATLAIVQQRYGNCPRSTQSRDEASAAC